MKKFSLLMAVVLAAFIAGCASNDALGEGASSIEDSALEVNNLEGAPSWVLNGGRGGFSAIGSADITKAGLQFARNEALAMARDELGRMVSVKIEGVINNAVTQSIGNAAIDANVEKFGEQITRQVVNQTMSGTKQKDTWMPKNGAQIYVLVEMEDNLAQKAKQIIAQDIANKPIPVEKDKFLDALDRALGNEL